MTLNSRVEKLETEIAAKSPVVVWLEGDETAEQACGRLGLDPNSHQYRLFIRFRRNADEVAS